MNIGFGRWTLNICERNPKTGLYAYDNMHISYIYSVRMNLGDVLGHIRPLWLICF